MGVRSGTASACSPEPAGLVLPAGEAGQLGSLEHEGAGRRGFAEGRRRPGRSGGWRARGARLAARGPRSTRPARSSPARRAAADGRYPGGAGRDRPAGSSATAGPRRPGRVVEDAVRARGRGGRDAIPSSIWPGGASREPSRKSAWRTSAASRWDESAASSRARRRWRTRKPAVTTSEEAGRDQPQGRHRGQPPVPSRPLAEPLAQRGLGRVLQRQVVELALEVLVQLARIDSGAQDRGAGSAGRSIRRRARPWRSTGASAAAARADRRSSAAGSPGPARCGSGTGAAR